MIANSRGENLVCTECGLRAAKYPSLRFLNRHAGECGTTRFGAFPDAWLMCDYPDCRNAACLDMYGGDVLASLVMRGWDIWLHHCPEHAYK